VTASSATGPKRFVAATATEALTMVKQAIGSDAILLSNREVEEGIEIIAMAQDQFKEVAPRSTPKGTMHLAPQRQTLGLRPQSSDFEEGIPVAQVADRTPRPDSLRQRADTAIRTANHKLVIADVATSPIRNTDGSPVYSADMVAGHFKNDVTTSTVKSAGAQNKVDVEPVSKKSVSHQELGLIADRIMGQVHEVRELLQTHLAGNAWAQLKGASPARAELLKRLLSAGFSPALSTSLIEEVRQENEDTSLLSQLRSPLARRMKTLDPIALFDQGGVFAFIGPTGVGKTTTVAKIAARCVMRFGRKSVSLLSTDTYRIGALEQLRVFGKILGLPVTSLRDADDLASRLAELEKFHVVLIDTAGMGQRDVKMVEQLRVLSDGYKQAQRLLVLSATTSLQTMQDVIQAHSQGRDNAIKGAVITKVDEAMSLAPAVDCLIRHELPLLFIGNGQQVPEDLHLADPSYLAHRSLQPRLQSADFEPEDDMVPGMIADSISNWGRRKD
jgi:flagellar biosynthesis protein FlhF